MSKRKSDNNKSIKGTQTSGSSENPKESVYEDISNHLLMDFLAHSRVAHSSGTYALVMSHLNKVMAELETRWLETVGKVGELDRRTLIHSSTLEKLDADVDALKKEKREIHEERGWPRYASEDFAKIVENSTGLDNAGENKSQILYHIMELEALSGKVEKKARVTNRKYESRLAASLRDICRVHEPSEISEEQIKRFTACVRALIEGWGKLNREKVKWIRNRLLEVGLTWLPITDKATKDVSGAKTLTE